MNTEPKILIFDIETSPNLAFVWGHYQQDVIEQYREWELLCFAWKWLGQKKIYALDTYKSKEKDIVEELWRLFDEADVVVAHNGDSFDIKKANSKFLEYGLTPPSGYKSVDTRKVARKHFRFNTNRLNDIAKSLKIGEKAPTGGFELWKGCMNGDRKSWKKMVDYNKKDVDLLEKVYLKLRGWMTNHPNSNVYTGSSHDCPVCGSSKTQARGFSITRVGRRQRYQCQEQACGAWSQGELVKTDAVLR